MKTIAAIAITLFVGPSVLAAEPEVECVITTEKAKYTAMKTEVGDFAADPSDPGGKLHFAIKAGDVLLKAAPPKGDFVLFQLRMIDGRWLASISIEGDIIKCRRRWRRQSQRVWGLLDRPRRQLGRGMAR